VNLFCFEQSSSQDADLLREEFFRHLDEPGLRGASVCATKQRVMTGAVDECIQTASWIDFDKAILSFEYFFIKCDEHHSLSVK